MCTAITNPDALAEDVLRRHHLTHRLPVPVLEVCRHEGLRDVREATFRDPTISAIIRREPRGHVLYVNQAHDLMCQRFTAAHALGHFLWHGLTGPGRSHLVEHGDVMALYHRVGDGSPEEQAANRFAAALLMPTATVRRLADVLPTATLAECLAVSRTTLLVRLGHLAIDAAGMWG